eukprot:TRINITY_DN1342_c0_g1_i5.p1 TRINITY_DN1342_c0_g1~~TRINITY_DN1342_c0_g1_i5.p1  ORF type:complete len:607 (+),score=151.06 TRINITY_DN1342_c0_g1_i5:279-2099(+)
MKALRARATLRKKTHAEGDGIALLEPSEHNDASDVLTPQKRSKRPSPREKLAQRAQNRASPREKLQAMKEEAAEAEAGELTLREKRAAAEQPAWEGPSRFAHIVDQPSLEQVMALPVALRYFKQYARSSGDLDIMLFYFEVEKYKTATMSRTLRVRTATAIVQKFLTHGAEFDIQMADAIKERTKESCEAPRFDSFDEAQEDALRQLRDDVFPEFADSEVFEEYVAVSNQLLCKREALEAATTLMETETMEMAEVVQSKTAAIDKATDFFHEAHQRINSLKSRCSVFTDLVEAATTYVDTMAGQKQNEQGVRWHDVNKLRKQLHVVRDAQASEEEEQEEERVHVVHAAHESAVCLVDNPLAAIAEDCDTVDVIVEPDDDCVKIAVDGKVRQGKGTKESVDEAVEFLIKMKNDVDSWQKVSENKRQNWQLFKAKGGNKWKAEATCQGVQPESVLGVLQAVELRSAWDPTMCNYKLLQTVNEKPHQAYLHVHAKGQMQMQDHDMVEFRTILPMTDGSYWLVYQGSTHGRAPVSQQVHRAECTLSGYLIEPWKSEDGQKTGCKLFAYSNIAYKVRKAHRADLCADESSTRAAARMGQENPPQMVHCLDE